MKVIANGGELVVEVSEADIYSFNSRWPCSELRELTGVTFTFDKPNGDLVDIEYANGSSDDWDGSALVALSEDAREFGIMDTI